jgi:hypothetical protein
MGLMTILISLPFVFSSNRLPNLNQVIQFGTGALSIVIGFGLMYKIGQELVHPLSLRDIVQGRVFHFIDGLF